MPSAATRRISAAESSPDDLVGVLQRASAARNAVPRNETVDAIELLLRHASVRGLSPEHLEALVDVLTSTPCYTDQASARDIVKLLLPREKVPEDIVVRVVGCLGQGATKPPLLIQASLLRWLVMIYNSLKDYSALSKLYGVLFNFLDMITLRPHLCHLLSLMTRRKHVRPFRIQALLELKRSVGNDQPLCGLLRVYKTYYPDIIVGYVGASKCSVFSHPDTEWMQKLSAIQESAAMESSEHAMKSTFRVVRRANGRGSKRRKIGRFTLPEIHTFQAVESSITLEEIENVNDFVNKLDKLELPNQIAAVLENGLMQKLLQLKPSVQANERLHDWLSACLVDELRVARSTAPGAFSRKAKILSKIAQYTRCTGRLVPAVETFLQRYLQLWDGESNLEAILCLIGYLPLREFTDLYRAFFKPLEDTAIAHSKLSQAQMLDSYTELLRHWTMACQGQSLRGKAFDEACLILRKFLEHVNRLSLTLLQRSDGDHLITDAVLWFYEHSSSLPWQNGYFRVVLPPDPLIYHLVFAGDSMKLSRLCGILARYKKAFERSFDKKTQPLGRNGEPLDYPRLYVDHFNGFLMDICNCLWRNRAFVGEGSKQDQNALGCTLKRVVVTALQDAAAARGEAIVSLFSLSHSPVLGSLSASCFRAMENVNASTVRTRHAGAVTTKSLSQLSKNGGLNITYSEFRVAILNDLGRKGLIGIWDFMHNTMVSLITSTANNARFSTRAPVRG